MRGTRIAAILIVLSVFGCGARDIAPYQAALDSLGLPSAWQVAKTLVRSQGGADGCFEVINGNCPSITRYYVTSGPLPDLMKLANDAAAANGFDDIVISDPVCDSATSTIAPACFMTAKKSDMALEVTVYRPGVDVDGLGISVPDHATVRMILRHN